MSTWFSSSHQGDAQRLFAWYSPLWMSAVAAVVYFKFYESFTADQYVSPTCHVVVNSNRQFFSFPQIRPVWALRELTVRAPADPVAALTNTRHSLLAAALVPREHLDRNPVVHRQLLLHCE